MMYCTKTISRMQATMNKKISSGNDWSNWILAISCPVFKTSFEYSLAITRLEKICLLLIIQKPTPR